MSSERIRPRWGAVPILTQRIRIFGVVTQEAGGGWASSLVMLWR